MKNVHMACKTENAQIGSFSRPEKIENTKSSSISEELKVIQIPLYRELGLAETNGMGSLLVPDPTACDASFSIDFSMLNRMRPSPRRRAGEKSSSYTDLLSGAPTAGGTGPPAGFTLITGRRLIGSNPLRRAHCTTSLDRGLKYSTWCRLCACLPRLFFGLAHVNPYGLRTMTTNYDNKL
ncbi:unnamed protein product [Nesidiocoris tenuis]|uniref:Uncharacterized protein n=1 Tax=Nesidiocoris tenuis TaxID=355587 RepID=A0A6H5HHC1_9HEMI|nr:unnamed protein product [Nesidiocoris tenuis]